MVEMLIEADIIIKILIYLYNNYYLLNLTLYQLRCERVYFYISEDLRPFGRKSLLISDHCRIKILILQWFTLKNGLEKADF
jgi:hypothetical protein